MEDDTQDTDNAGTTTPQDAPNDETASPRAAPLGGYRQPSPASVTAQQEAPRQHLGTFAAGPLGSLVVELDLGDRLEIAVNRRLLRIDAGGGVLVHNDQQLPEVVLRALDVDLGTLEVDLDAEGIAEAEGTVLGIAGAELLRLHFGASTGPDGTAVDLWLAQQEADSRGRRRLLEVPSTKTSVWLDPSADLRLRVGPREAEVVLSKAIRVAVLGIGIGIAAVRYIFGQQRVEIERAPGLRGVLTAPLLMLGAWIASRWLRQHLPAPVGTEGYNPWTDPDRVRHLNEAARALAPQRDTTATAAPPPAQRPDLTQLATELTAASPDSALWVIARLSLAFGAAKGGELGLTLRHSDALRIRVTALGITLSAADGLFLYADGHPALQRLHVLEVCFMNDAEAVTLTTQPPLGSLAHALLNKLLQTSWMSKIPLVLRQLLTDLREHPDEPFLWSRDLGGGRTLSLCAEAGFALDLSLLGDEVQLHCEQGLMIEVQGTPVPTTTLHRLRYFANGAVEVESTPELGDLECRTLAAFVGHRLAGQIPTTIHLFSPAARAAAEESAEAPRRAVVGGRTHVLYEATLPQVGAVQALLDPSDELRAELHPGGLRVRSERGVLVKIDELEHDIDILGASLGFDGSIDLQAVPAPGLYVSGLLATFYRDLLGDKIAAWLPAPTSEQEPWVLLRRNVGELELVVQLPAGAKAELLRDAAGLRLHAPAGVQLIAHGPASIPDVALTLVELTWDAAADTVGLGTEPAAGDLLHELLRLAVVYRGKPHMELVRRMLALPQGPATPQPAPAPTGPVIYQRAVPALGTLEVALQRSYFMIVMADDRGRISASIEGGLRASVRDIGLELTLTDAVLDVGSGELCLTMDPAVGPLETALATTAVDHFLPVLRRSLWPTDDLRNAQSDATLPTLAVFAREAEQGPLTLSLPQEARLKIALDRQMLEIEPEMGLRIDLAGASWLPPITLEKVTYTLADGSISLRFQALAEQHYREAESVSTMTESILSDLVRVFIHPHLSEALAPLGLVRLELPPAVTIEAEFIELFSVSLGEEYGDAIVGMDPDEVLSITASESDEEISLHCERSLTLALPKLRLRERIASARYHLSSGEVQVDGLGQIENMVIEAIFRKNVITPALGGAPLSSVLDTLPADAEGNRELFATTGVSIRLQPGVTFIMIVSATGIDFTAAPPILVDGPGVINYELCGFNYDFAKARFTLILDEEGVLAELLEGLVAGRVEAAINSQLQPLLPPVMRVPGYNLARDPNSAATLAAIVVNFGMRGSMAKAT